MRHERKLLKCDTLWVVPIWNKDSLFHRFHHIPFSNHSLLAKLIEDYKDLLHLPTVWLPRPFGIKRQILKLIPTALLFSMKALSRTAVFSLPFSVLLDKTYRLRGKKWEKKYFHPEKYTGIQRQKRRYCILRNGEKLATKIYLRNQR